MRGGCLAKFGEDGIESFGGIFTALAESAFDHPAPLIPEKVEHRQRIGPAQSEQRKASAPALKRQAIAVIRHIEGNAKLALGVNVDAECQC